MKNFIFDLLCFIGYYKNNYYNEIYFIYIDFLRENSYFHEININETDLCDYLKPIFFVPDILLNNILELKYSFPPSRKILE